MTMTSACAIKPPIAAKPKTVTVNGVEISRAAIALETQNHPAAKPIEAWLAAARALLVRELLLQEARRLAMTAAPLADGDGRRETGDEALVRALIEQEIHTPEPDAAECERYYSQNLRKFRSPDLFEVSHILIAAAPNDRAARAASRHRAEGIVSELGSAPEQFPVLARLNSACPSREVGGNLGQIGPGQTVAEFERALPELPIGVVHGVPIETRYGFHIVRVDRRETGRQLPFDLVRERIADYLAECVRSTAIRQYISMLVGRAAITGIDLAGAPSPLVQ